MVLWQKVRPSQGPLTRTAISHNVEIGHKIDLMERSQILHLLPGLDTTTLPLSSYGEREEFHVDRIIRSAIELVEQALQHGDASTEKLVEALRAFNPAYLEHPDFKILAQVGFRDALELLNDITPTILLPHGHFLVINVVGREIEICEGRVVDKEYLTIPYLDGLFQIKFAEARFKNVTPDKHRQSISGYFLLDSELAQIDAISILDIAKQPMMQRRLPSLAAITKLQERYAVSDQEYCQLAGTTRAFFAGVAALQDRIYANAFDGKLEAMGNLDARLASRLIKPKSSLHHAVESGLSSQQAEFDVFPEILATISLSGQLSGLLQELQVYVSDQAWERGHLAIVDFYVTNKMVSQISAENETFHYKSQIVAAKWLAKEINSILGGDTNINRSILEARPKIAVERFRDCVLSIFSKNFYSQTERMHELRQIFG